MAFDLFDPAVWVIIIDLVVLVAIILDCCIPKKNKCDYPDCSGEDLNCDIEICPWDEPEFTG